MTVTVTEPQRTGIDPVVPAVGSPITLFGLSGIVADVVPETDWSWRVTALVERDGREEELVSIVPTDFRTTDGQAAYGWEIEVDRLDEDENPGLGSDWNDVRGAIILGRAMGTRTVNIETDNVRYRAVRRGDVWYVADVD